MSRATVQFDVECNDDRTADEFARVISARFRHGLDSTWIVGPVRVSIEAPTDKCDHCAGRDLCGGVSATEWAEALEAGAGPHVKTGGKLP